MTKPIMPVFIFGRRRDIEIETGLILAGMLIVDIPKGTKPKRRHQRMISGILQQLVDGARSGRMPDDAMVYGWPGGTRPPNADETVDDDKLMAAWAKERVSIAVRIDPRNDGLVRLDSDIARQMGLVRGALTASFEF